jgi:hypothetical protein
MANALGAYGATWFVIFFFKFIGYFAGVPLLVSPFSFLLSTIVFFVLCFILNKKFNPHKEDATANIITGIALVPYFLIISTVLHWNGSYYCQSFFIEKGSVWPHPNEWEAGTLTLAIMNSHRKNCFEDPFNYFGGFEYTFNGWILILLLVVLGLALVLAIVLIFFTLKDSSLKEIIYELRHGAPEWEVEEKKKKRVKITKGIGKTGREVVNWNGKATDILKDGNFHGEDRFIFCRANVQDIIKREHLSKGDYLTWFGRLGEEYLDSYSKYKDKYPKKEVIDQINWARSHILKVYTGKSASTGKKREEKLLALLKEIESL